MTTLTSLGSATAPTVLHNLLRSHLELSLMAEKEDLGLGRYTKKVYYHEDFRPLQ